MSRTSESEKALSAPPNSGGTLKLFPIVLLSIIFIILLLQGYGIRTSLPSIKEVYDTRDEFILLSAQGSSFLKYIVSWIPNVLAPLLLCIGFIKRKFLLILLGFVSLIYVYSLTGYKHIFFNLLLVLLVPMVLKGRSYFGIVFPLFITLLIVIGNLIYFSTGDIEVISIFARRMIITPGLLLAFYVDYFSTFPFTYYANSFLKYFISYTYDLPIPYIIGRHYFGNAEMGANVNIWGDSFGAFGYLGMVAISILTGWLLRFCIKLTATLNLRLALTIIWISFLPFINSGFFTSILTHGVGFMLILVVLGKYKFIGAQK